MNGKHHLYVALAFGTVLYIIIGLLHLGDNFPNPFWPYFFGTILGGAFPDIDITFGGIKRHRNPVTHSGILQIGITVSYMFTTDYSGFIFFLMFFFVGNASHLMIDIIPGSCPKEYTTIGGRWGYRLNKMLKGKTTGNIIGIPARHEQKWLLIHAGLLFLMAFLLYLKLQYGINLDMPVVW